VRAMKGERNGASEDLEIMNAPSSKEPIGKFPGQIARRQGTTLQPRPDARLPKSSF
jgi:hypothetical protein